MAVNFQVVGIFYTTQVDLGLVGGNTVGEIIQYLFKADPNFYYASVVADENPIISMLGVYHPDPFTGRTGIEYPVGFYGLTQTFTSPTPNPYTVWQYYLSDQNNVRQPQPGDLSYTQAQVQDGWSIIWRLVTILNGPGNLSKRLKQFDAKLVTNLTGTP